MVQTEKEISELTDKVVSVLQEKMDDRMKKLERDAWDYARSNTKKAVVIAAGGGAVIGMLFGHWFL